LWFRNVRTLLSVEATRKKQGTVKEGRGRVSFKTRLKPVKGDPT